MTTAKPKKLPIAHKTGKTAARTGVKPKKAAPAPAVKKLAAAKKPVAKKAVGRPTAYSQSVVDVLLAELAEGKSLRTVCKSAAMPNIATVMRWLADDSKPGFREQYARAREAQAEILADEVVSILDGDGKGKDDAVKVARDRARADGRKWYASKLAPKRYGDKLVLGGSDDLPPIQTASKSDAETAVHLAKIFAGLAKQ